MKKYVFEFIGALFVVLIFMLTHFQGNSLGMAPAVGLSISVLVFAGRRISGAFCNPALNLAMLMTRRIDAIDFLYYTVGQLAGAALAGSLAVFMLHCSGIVDLEPVRHTLWCALLAEFLGTFLLVLVWLFATQSPSEHPAASGLSIGFAYIAAALAFGPVSGAMFNPAIGFGMCLSGLASWSELLIAVAAQMLAAAAAVTIFVLLRENQENA